MQEEMKIELGQIQLSLKSHSSSGVIASLVVMKSIRSWNISCKIETRSLPFLLLRSLQCRRSRSLASPPSQGQKNWRKIEEGARARCDCGNFPGGRSRLAARLRIDRDGLD